MRRLVITLIIAVTAAAASVAADSGRASFAWGADIGSGIDMSGHDMSNIGFNAYFGLKSSAMQFAGVGAGIDMMMGNNCRAFPVYAMARTSFGVKNAPCFASLKAGCCFNNFDADYRKTSLYLAPGVGFNLAVGEKYRSYIILSYVYNGVKYDGGNPDFGQFGSLSYANVSIGITF